MKLPRRLLALFLIGSTFVVSCSAAQKAAQEDPMKCERDPKCDKKRSRSFDCSAQCTDDPACMERCEQGQQGQKLGH